MLGAFGRRGVVFGFQWSSLSRSGSRSYSKLKFASEFPHLWKSNIIDVEGIPEWDALPADPFDVMKIFSAKHRDYLDDLYTRQDKKLKCQYISSREYMGAFQLTCTSAIVPFYEGMCRDRVVVADFDPCPTSKKRPTFDTFLDNLRKGPVFPVKGGILRYLKDTDLYFLFFDGSYKEYVDSNGQKKFYAGGAYAILNSAGEIIGCKFMPFPNVRSSVEAVLMSITEGAEVIANMPEIQKVLIMGDCDGVVRKLKGLDVIKPADYRIYCHIFKCLKSKLYFDAKHIFRESNQIAELLARYGLRLDEWLKTFEDWRQKQQGLPYWRE